MVPTNAATRYEVALMKGETVVKFLGFTARATKGAIWDYMLDNGPEIGAIAGVKKDDAINWNAKRKAW